MKKRMLLAGLLLTILSFIVYKIYIYNKKKEELNNVYFLPISERLQEAQLLYKDISKEKFLKYLEINDQDLFEKLLNLEFGLKKDSLSHQLSFYSFGFDEDDDKMIELYGLSGMSFVDAFFPPNGDILIANRSYADREKIKYLSKGPICFTKGKLTSIDTESGMLNKLLKGYLNQYYLQEFKLDLFGKKYLYLPEMADTCVFEISLSEMNYVLKPLRPTKFSNYLNVDSLTQQLGIMKEHSAELLFIPVIVAKNKDSFFLSTH